MHQRQSIDGIEKRDRKIKYLEKMSRPPTSVEEWNAAIAFCATKSFTKCLYEGETFHKRGPWNYRMSIESRPAIKHFGNEIPRHDNEESCGNCHSDRARDDERIEDSHWGTRQKASVSPMRQRLPIRPKAWKRREKMRIESKTVTSISKCSGNRLKTSEVAAEWPTTISRFQCHAWLVAKKILISPWLSEAKYAGRKISGLIKLKLVEKLSLNVPISSAVESQSKCERISIRNLTGGISWFHGSDGAADDHLWSDYRDALVNSVGEKARVYDDIRWNISRAHSIYAEITGQWRLGLINDVTPKWAWYHQSRALKTDGILKSTFSGEWAMAVFIL